MFYPSTSITEPTNCDEEVDDHSQWCTVYINVMNFKICSCNAPKNGTSSLVVILVMISARFMLRSLAHKRNSISVVLCHRRGS